MSFWHLKEGLGNQIAVIEDEGTRPTEYTYSQLNNFIKAFQMYFQELPRSLGFIYCQNNLASLISYVASLQEKQVICLLDANLNEKLNQELLKLYEPDWIWAPKEKIFDGYKNLQGEFGYCFNVKDRLDRPFYPDLAVLLSTSGTTGSPKMVQLSYGNLQENAQSIFSYLNIHPSHRAITTLPMQYSYGLSVINSHLLKGSSLVLTEKSILTKKFWDLVSNYKVTSFSGVPFTYEMLYKIGFLEKHYPSLKVMTQAGGRLDTHLKKEFQRVLSDRNVDFYVMYGQTEATARISYVPPTQLAYKIDSIGIPIPKGALEIDLNTNELIYTGPNVMLGYAYSWNDLNNGDELKGRLPTGDIAKCDKDGFYYIVGRRKRFIKLFGLRINLDDVEMLVESTLNIKIYSVGNDKKVVIVGKGITDADLVKKLIAKTYKIPANVVKVMNMESEIPRFPNGKINYKQLWEKVSSCQ